MAHILSLGTHVPPHCLYQKDLAKKIAKASNLDAKETKWLERLYQNSAIKKRYSVLEEFCHDVSEWHFWKEGAASTLQRNELYKTEAPKLAYGAALQALAEWGQDPQLITHIIFISCTGVMAPGVQAILQQRLGLKNDVVQFGLNLMGCFGAFKGLDMAKAFASQNPKNRVLVVSCELCSLHFQQQQSQELQVGNAIFSDGAAACVVGDQPESQEKSLWKIVQTKSLMLPNTLEKMTWEVSDSGFILGLKEEVVDCILNNIAQFKALLLGDSIDPNDCHWPIHPGGKMILKACEAALKLTRNELHASWQVLEEYGNMSSATFLFVLDHLRTHSAKKRWAVGFGFGPGLIFEGILLQ